MGRYVLTNQAQRSTQLWRSWIETKTNKLSSGHSSSRLSTYLRRDARKREYRFSYTQAIIVIRGMRTLLGLQVVVLAYLLVRLVQEGLVWMAFSTLLLLSSSLIAFGVLHSMLKPKTDSGETENRTPSK